LLNKATLKIGITLISALFAGLISCQTPAPAPDAKVIIDNAISAAGGDNFEGAEISFTFRNMDYRSLREAGLFTLERIQTDTLNNIIRDVLSNDGFQRFRNDTAISVADSMAFKYTESVNSVHYFAYLPFGLGDPAVRSKYLGQATIKDKLYHKIEITFNADGGGVDHEDVFLYWIEPETNTVDYLAYSFKTNGGGIRFREAYNQRVVGGIRFADYVNYKANPDVDFYATDSLFNVGALKKLSVIELENIQVKQK
jgi:hypothetical protein